MTKTQLQQMLSYCEHAANEGWYYGNKEQFIARHEAIVKWIQEQLKEQK